MFENSPALPTAPFDSTEPTASLGVIGGSSNEAGSEYRADVAVELVVAALSGYAASNMLPHSIRALRNVTAVPTGVYLEVDAPTDDIECTFEGARALLQVKRTVDIKILQNVLEEQWIPTIISESWTAETALVLVSADPSQTIQTLANAWLRVQDPNAGALSTQELAQLQKWNQIVTNALELFPKQNPSFIRRQIENSVVFVQIAGGGKQSSSAQTSLARLANSVVRREQAEAALNALGQAVRSMAVKRTGGTTRDWAGILERTDGLDLISRADGATSAQIIAEKQALDAYLRSISSKLNRIPLHSFGVALPDVVVPGMASSVSVSEDNTKRHSGVGLLDAVRGCSRMMLVGPAGSGKSEALRQLAAFAANSTAARQNDEELANEWLDLGEWSPLPVFVPLTRLLPPPDSREPRIVLEISHVAKAAAEHQVSSTIDLTARIIEKSIMTSPTLLLLDGLDECRDRIHEMVVRLNELFKALPAECTVVVTSRPHAEVDAGMLEMKSKALQRPDALGQTTSRILTAFAFEQPKNHQDEWVERRIAWLGTQTSSHQELFALPLMSVLAAVVAGSTGELGDLPQGRAGLVGAVLNRFVDLWEVRHRSLELGGSQLDRVSATAAMNETFTIISHVLNETGRASESSVRSAIAQHLHSRYLTAIGLAEITAKSMLWAWVESGILQRSKDGTISPRLRLFVDVGESLYAIARPELIDNWLTARIDDRARYEEIRLAAELSTNIADFLIALLESTNAQNPEFVDRAILCQEILQLSQHRHDIEQLNARLAAVVFAASNVNDVYLPIGLIDTVMDPESVADSEATDRWRLWVQWTLLEIYIDFASPDLLLANREKLVSPLPQNLANMALASIWTRVIFGGRIADDTDMKIVSTYMPKADEHALSSWAAIIPHALMELPKDPRLTDLAAFLGTSRHTRTIVTASAVLLPKNPDLAPEIERLSQYIGQSTGIQLRDILDRNGYGALLSKVREEEREQAAALGQMLNRKDENLWLERLSKSAHPSKLTRWQQWRRP